MMVTVRHLRQRTWRSQPQSLLCKLPGSCLLIVERLYEKRSKLEPSVRSCTSQSKRKQTTTGGFGRQPSTGWKKPRRRRGKRSSGVGWWRTKLGTFLLVAGPTFQIPRRRFVLKQGLGSGPISHPIPGTSRHGRHRNPSTLTITAIPQGHRRRYRRSRLRHLTHRFSLMFPTALDRGFNEFSDSPAWD